MIHDKVALRRLKSPEKTETGILLPQRAQKPVKECEVVAVGPGRFATDDGRLIPTTLKVGQKVFIGPGWDEIEYQGEKLVVMTEDQIFAVIPE